MREGSSNVVRLSLKRLVRRGVARVSAMLPDGGVFEYEAYDGENLRMGLLARGKTVNDQTSQRRAAPGPTLSLSLYIYMYMYINK